MLETKFKEFSAERKGHKLMLKIGLNRAVNIRHLSDFKVEGDTLSLTLFNGVEFLFTNILESWSEHLRYVLKDLLKYRFVNGVDVFGIIGIKARKEIKAFEFNRGIIDIESDMGGFVIIHDHEKAYQENLNDLLIAYDVVETLTTIAE